jgi:hypothetical protein
MYLDGTDDVFAKRMDLSHILFTKGRSKDYYPWVRNEFHTKSEFMEGSAVPEPFSIAKR